MLLNIKIDIVSFSSYTKNNNNNKKKIGELNLCKIIKRKPKDY
jgi:hypothetical protein